MKTFGWTRPVRDVNGEIIDTKESLVRVRTQSVLGHGYGPDNDKRLVFTMGAGDLVNIRPERTTRSVNIRAIDLYAYCLRIEANRQCLENARAKKARKAERLAQQRQARAEKRLTRSL